MAQKSDELIITLNKNVRIIRLNRPKTKNAFNNYFYRTITDTLNQDAQNDSIVMTIITGNGDYYSSGFDIVSAMNNQGNLEDGIDVLSKMIEAFITYPKILVALVNGPALGIAVTTLALCDLVYASDKATFETPFIKIGLCAEGCSSYTFPRIMGRAKASEMLLLGKKFTAQEAFQANFVTRIVPHAKLDQVLQQLQDTGNQLPVNSVKINKKLLMNHSKDILCECNQIEIAQIKNSFNTDEFSAAMIKFISRKSKL